MSPDHISILKTSTAVLEQFISGDIDEKKLIDWSYATRDTLGPKNQLKGSLENFILYIDMLPGYESVNLGIVRDYLQEIRNELALLEDNQEKTN